MDHKISCVANSANLENGKIYTVDVPEGETRFTTRGITIDEAIKNFEKIFADSAKYVRQINGKLQCLVDWGNGPEWIDGDVITQLRGVDNPLYMFTPIDKSVIESPEWAVRNAETGEMYKPAARDIKVCLFAADTKIPYEFSYENREAHKGTYVFIHDGELRVMDLESLKMNNVTGSPLVGKILIEGARKHELYAITAKVFDKKKAVLTGSSLNLQQVINEFLKSMQIENPAAIRVEDSKLGVNNNERRYYNIIITDKNNIEHCINVDFDSSELLSHWFCVIERIIFKCDEYYFSAVDEAAASLIEGIIDILLKGNINFITWQNEKIKL